MSDSFKNSALHQELLEKYISIKRSRRRKKRVPANTWVTAEKLPPGYKHKRRKPPKIDDDDELDNALSSIEMNHCSTTNYDDSMVKNQFQVNTNPIPIPTSNTTSTPTIQNIDQPLILDDFDVADIDESVLLDCLFTNLEEITMGSVDVDSIKLDQSQQSMTDSQQLEFLNELFKDYELNFTPTSSHPDLINLQLNNNFTIEPAQESILSSTSPFPSSMSSPSIPSTSPNQQNNLDGQHQVPNLLSTSSSSSPSLSPPPPPQTTTTTTTTTTPLPPCLPPSLPDSACPPSTSPCPSSPPSQKPQSAPQPSYGKNIYLLLNDKTNQTDSCSEYSSESESEN